MIKLITVNRKYRFSYIHIHELVPGLKKSLFLFVKCQNALVYIIAGKHDLLLAIKSLKHVVITSVETFYWANNEYARWVSLVVLEEEDCKLRSL